MPKGKNKKAKSLRAVRGGTRLRNTNPPPLNTNVMFQHRFRFQANAAFDNILTAKSLLNVGGSIGTIVNSTVALFSESVKLNHIEIWTPPASQGAAATVSVNWLSPNSPSIEISDTTLSVSHNAHISTRPPNGSLASFWFNMDTGGTDVFRLTCPINSIIDVSCQFVLVDRNAAASTQASLATVVVGRPYWLALDNNLGTDILVPVSMTTTT